MLQITRWTVADQFRKRKKGSGSWLPNEDSEMASVIITAPSFKALEDFQVIWDAE